MLSGFELYPRWVPLTVAILFPSISCVRHYEKEEPLFLSNIFDIISMRYACSGVR